jgi:hypothetical protein
MYVRGGTDQVLGTGSSYAKNNLTYGTWSATQNCVIVKDADGNDMASPTHYYNVRTAATNILYARANSTVNQNGYTSNVLDTVIIRRGVKDTCVLTFNGSSDLTVTSIGDLPEGLTLSNGAISGTTNVANGKYTTTATISVDGWVTKDVIIEIEVVSAMTINGTAITDGQYTIASGTEYEGILDTPYYAYGATLPGAAVLWGGYFIADATIIDWYGATDEQQADGWTYEWCRDEEKTKALHITTSTRLKACPMAYL